jgi:glycosyltransferase domain-containing protein
VKDKLTLIIPSRNRHSYLSRIIEYYCAIDSLSILICDSSQEKYKEVSSLPDHISYNHLPGYLFIEKIDKVASSVNTPYILLCADDDFITPEGIKSMLDFLDQNLDYSSVQGNSISFYYEKNKVFYAPLYEQITGLEIGSNIPRERLAQFFENDIQLFYSVHRSNIFKEIFSTASGKIKSLNLLESYIGTRSIITGKHKVLPVFYGVREILYDSAGRLVGLNILSTEQKYEEEYNFFISELGYQLSLKENTTLESAKIFLKEVIKNHINRRYDQKLLKSQNRLKRIKKWVPFFVRKYYRYRILLQKDSKQRESNIVFAQKHPGFPFNDHKGIKELERIEGVIKKHNIR